MHPTHPSKTLTPATCRIDFGRFLILSGIAMFLATGKSWKNEKYILSKHHMSLDTPSIHTAPDITSENRTAYCSVNPNDCNGIVLGCPMNGGPVHIDSSVCTTLRVLGVQPYQQFNVIFAGRQGPSPSCTNNSFVTTAEPFSWPVNFSVQALDIILPKPKNDVGDTNINTGAIVGFVIGGVTFVAITTTGIWYYIRFRRQISGIRNRTLNTNEEVALVSPEIGAREDVSLISPEVGAREDVSLISPEVGAKEDGISGDESIGEGEKLNSGDCKD
ncbi:hypothetical protein AAMO2058_000680900 [Amorphochlora amoebiformis]